MKKGESFLINQPSVRQLMREIYCISTNAVHLLIMQNHAIINAISATGTTSTNATLNQLLTLENKTTISKQLYRYITSSLSLAVLLIYYTNIFKINKRADTIMEHTSGPSFHSVRSRMVRIYSLPWLLSTIIRAYYNDVSMVPSLGVKWR